MEQTIGYRSTNAQQRSSPTAFVILLVSARWNKFQGYKSEKHCILMTPKTKQFSRSDPSMKPNNQISGSHTGNHRPGYFFGNAPLFFRYSGVNVANATNFVAKRRWCLFLPTKTTVKAFSVRWNPINAFIPEKTSVYFFTPWRIRNSWSVIKFSTKGCEAFRAFF